MQKFFLKLTGLAMVSLLIFTTSCENDDETPGGGSLGPIIQFVFESGFLNEDSTVSPGESFQVKIDAQPGDSPLNALTVLENGSNLATDRYSITNISVTNNPQVLTGTDKDGAILELTIDAQSDVSETTYTIEVTDEAGQSDEVSLVIGTFGDLTFGIVLDDSDPAYLSQDATLGAQGPFEVRLLGSRGAAAISSLAVFQDDVAVDAARLTFNGGAISPANPLSIPEADKNTFETIVAIDSHDSGTSSYSFELTDEDGNKVSTSLNITIGTPVETLTGTLLRNQGGPACQGGLDLDEGLETGTQSDPSCTTPFTAAEIKDEGIDLSLPNDQNWKQQISGFNGSEIRTPSASLPEGFSFENIATKEAIASAFDLSDPLTMTNSDGEGITSTVQVGDVFLINNGDNYYIIQVTDIDVTTASNNDSYTFSIKK